MRYKIRVYSIKTDEEALTVSEVFESKEAAEMAIEQLKNSCPSKYEYVKVPVR